MTSNEQKPKGSSLTSIPSLPSKKLKTEVNKSDQLNKVHNIPFAIGQKQTQMNSLSPPKIKHHGNSIHPFKKKTKKPQEPKPSLEFIAVTSSSKQQKLESKEEEEGVYKLNNNKESNGNIKDTSTTSLSNHVSKGKSCFECKSLNYKEASSQEAPKSKKFEKRTTVLLPCDPENTYFCEQTQSIKKTWSVIREALSLPIQSVEQLQVLFHQQFCCSLTYPMHRM